MGFKPETVLQMQNILMRLAPGTQESLQFFYPEKKYTIKQTFFVKNKKGQYIYIFQYYEKLSPYRITLVQKLAKKIDYPLHMVTEGEYVCVGWKYGG
jgi:hypothetical protein